MPRSVFERCEHTQSTHLSNRNIERCQNPGTFNTVFVVCTMTFSVATNAQRSRKWSVSGLVFEFLSEYPPLQYISLFLSCWGGLCDVTTGVRNVGRGQGGGVDRLFGVHRGHGKRGYNHPQRYGE